MREFLCFGTVAETSNITSPFFAEQASDGVTPSPIFKCPGFKLDWVCIDVLHCCDLGVSQKIIGNVLYEAQQNICIGSTIKARTDDVYLVR